MRDAYGFRGQADCLGQARDAVEAAVGGCAGKLDSLWNLYINRFLPNERMGRVASAAGDRNDENRGRRARNATKEAKEIKTLTAARTATTVGLIMRLLKHLLLASAAGLLAVGAASAADLPTKKAAPAAEKPNCYASFYTWLDSTAADCPLSAYGVTVYGTIDMGGGYETHAAKFNKDYTQRRVGADQQEQRRREAGSAVPNGLSQSNVGVKIKEQIVPNWFIVGDVNFGFDPYSLQFANGPKSLVDNNNSQTNYCSQSANGDSSRAGQLGQHPRLSRRQQPDLRHADLRPPVRVHQRSFGQLRSVRRRLRLLADRHLRLGRAGHRRHRDGALQHLVQVSGRLQRPPRRRDRPGRRLGAGQRRSRRLSVRPRRRLRAASRSTRSTPTPRTR